MHKLVTETQGTAAISLPPAPLFPQEEQQRNQREMKHIYKHRQLPPKQPILAYR